MPTTGHAPLSLPREEQSFVWPRFASLRGTKQSQKIESVNYLADFSILGTKQKIFSTFAALTIKIIAMNTNITEKDGKYIVSLEGELDTAHALEVEQAMQPLHELSGKDITIDCAHLDYIASSGLRILLALLKSAKSKGNKVVLKNLNDEIKEVFKMTGFIDLFDIE